MILLGETESGHCGDATIPRIPRWAHRDDERRREDSFLRRQSPSDRKTPIPLKTPARRAEHSLTENVASPFQAEPGQIESDSTDMDQPIAPTLSNVLKALHAEMDA
jgi:hypothetical protein